MEVNVFRMRVERLKELGIHPDDPTPVLVLDGRRRVQLSLVMRHAVGSVGSKVVTLDGQRRRQWMQSLEGTKCVRWTELDQVIPGMKSVFCIQVRKETI